jgi:NAD(P) transhydrogenase
VVEKGRRVGGVSVHTGTIPSKTLRETVLNLSGWRERGFYGRAYRVKQDIEASDLMARMRKTLDHEVEVLEHQFSRNAVRTVRGQARFVGPHDIEVTGDAGETRVYTAANILIACGTTPFRPENVPFNGTTVLDSDEIVDLKKLPRSLAVIGAGVIGVEYATIFSALDVAVTLIEPRPTFLDFIDKEIIDELVHDFRDRKLALRLGSAVTAIALNEAGAPSITLANGRIVQADMLLYAAGRVGATTALNLEATGLTADHRGRIAVTPNTLQTSVPHIYAAGDVIGFPSLASTSMEQGRLAAGHAFGLKPSSMPDSFPYGAQEGYSVRMRHRPLSRDVARPDHGAELGHDEADLLHRDAAAARRPYHRRGRDRAHPHRPGRAQSERHHRLLHREHLQLSDAGGGLQDRRPRRLEPDGAGLR